VDDAKRDVARAQANLDRAKEKAGDGMAPADRAGWQRAEASFETAAAAKPKQVGDQKAAVEALERNKMKDGDREEVDAARDKLVGALARLDDAKTRLASDTRGTNNHDESSQAIQPENRTQNGYNFSIRSDRDSENHPPLPPSQ
jgi:hypothetical protein